MQIMKFPTFSVVPDLGKLQEIEERKITENSLGNAHIALIGWENFENNFGNSQQKQSK